MQRSYQLRGARPVKLDRLRHLRLARALVGTVGAQVEEPSVGVLENLKRGVHLGSVPHDVLYHLLERTDDRHTQIEPQRGLPSVFLAHSKSAPRSRSFTGWVARRPEAPATASRISSVRVAPVRATRIIAAWRGSCP